MVCQSAGTEKEEQGMGLCNDIHFAQVKAAGWMCRGEWRSCRTCTSQTAARRC